MNATAQLAAIPSRDRFRLMDISRATDLWLGELARQSRSESTVNGYRRLLDKLADTYPFADVDDLTASDVRRFLDAQARRRDGKRKAASTIGGNVSALNGFFDWLTKEGIVDRNPTRRNGDRIIDRPPQVAAEDNDNIVSVTFADVQRLLRESRRLGRWEETLAIHCLVYLGPRRKALSLVRLSDYDRLERTLLFKEKGGKTIRKPVPDELAAVIEAAIFTGAYQSPDDYLIPSKAQQRRPGDRDDRVIWRIVKEVAERANVTTHVHALRAAFAVHYLQSKPGEIVGLQKLMGHRRIETTMVYLRRLDRHEAMESVRDLSWNSEEREPFPVVGDEPTYLDEAPYDAPEFVYFIRAGDVIKIGYTADAPTTRMRQLQKNHHADLELAAVVHGGTRELELRIHQHFAQHRVRGEWFRPSFGMTLLIGHLAACHPRDSVAICEESLQSLPVTEKEGFEPSFDPMSLLQRDGSQHEASVPRKKA